MKGILSTMLLFLMMLGCSNPTSVQEEPKQEKEENSTVKTEETKKQQDDSSNQEPVDSEEETLVKETKPWEVEKIYRMNIKTYAIEPIEKTEKKGILLTIDDAPDTYSLEMAKKLKQLGVNAIFFVNGHFIDTKEEEAVLKEIYDMGFVIGNHTWNHAKLPDLTKEKQKEEIVPLSNKIEEITGERPKFFRAPHGLNTDYSRQLAEEEKMLLMNWSFGYDYFKEYMTEETLADIMVNTNLLHSGSNILMHDREWTYEALDEIVEGYKAKGFHIIDPHQIETP